MAWSYSQGSGERYRAEGAHFVRWWNAWSVTELAPVSPNTIRLRVSLSTSGFYQNSGYVWSGADSLSCGSASVPVRSYTAVAGLSYTEDIEVPGNWNGQTIRLNIGWCAVSAVLNATVALPSAIAAEDGVFGSAVPVTLTPALSGARHRVQASCAGHTELLLSESENAASCVWTPSVAVYAPLLPNAGSAAAVLSCETFYGGVSMGTSTATVTLRFAPESLTPQLSAGWVTAQVLNQGAASGLSGWIQGYSRARLVFDSTKISCRYGASVAACSVRGEGFTLNESPFDTPVLPGVVAALCCTVTDSRGQSASETLNLTLLPYTPPTFGAVESFRCDASGSANENESCLAVSAAAVLSPLGGENSASLAAALRVFSGSFGSETALTPGQRAILSGLSPDTSYELRLRLTDALGNTAVLKRTFPTRRWAMKLRPDGGGAAFGKAAELDAALELAPGWALVIRGPNGESARLDYAALTALLGTI